MLTVVTQMELPDLQERVQAIAPDAQVIYLPLDAPVPAELKADVLLTPGFGATNLQTLLEPSSTIRWVHAFSTGVDLFPTDLIGDRLFSCSRGASAVPISEWTLAMMLAFEKQVPESWIDAPPQQWHTTFQLQSLYGKRLALLGFGAIGEAIARRAAAFEMRIKALVRHPRELLGGHVESVTDSYALVKDADHLVLAAPATAATRNFVNAELLDAMKPGAHLINVARGALVDESALKAALDDGRLARASLDAVEPEPLPAGHWLYRHPRVRLSPHVSWSDPKTFDRLLDAFLVDFANFYHDKPLQGAVDLKEGY